MVDDLWDDAFVDEVDDEGVGVTKRNLGGAIAVWSFVWGDAATVARASETFRVSEGMVSEAIDLMPFHFIDGDMICCDGM